MTAKIYEDLTQAARDYLEKTKNKGMLTLQSSIDSAFYKEVQRLYALYDSEYHCPFIDELQNSEPSKYLEIIKYHQSINGEITPREIHDLMMLIDLHIHFGQDNFNDKFNALLERVKNEPGREVEKITIKNYEDFKAGKLE